ncbi:MAG: hypothetical protein ACR2MS_07020 [Weeksellaceae bacterium]
MKKIVLSFFMAVSAISMAQVGISPTNGFTPNQQPYNLNADITKAPMLDVDGKVRIRSAATATPNQYSPVVRNNNNGEVEVLASNAAVKPFNYVTYKIDNPSGDWLQNLNTQVNTSRYSMAIIGYRFLNDPNNPDNSFIAIGRNSPREKIDASGLTPTNETVINDGREENGWSKWDLQAVANVHAFKNNGTWHLAADFAGGGTYFWGNGYWEIQVLIIDNAFVNVLNDVTIDLNGSASGTAPVPTNLGQ